MKISLLKFLCLILPFFMNMSCATRSAKVVTMNSYLQVKNGETREDILKKFGEPVTIEMNDSGVEIFTYIERFELQQQVVEARYYYFYIKDGKVIGKVANVVNRPQTINSDQM